MRTILATACITVGLAISNQSSRAPFPVTTTGLRGSVVPLIYPAQDRGVLCLNELRTASVVAIVRPTGPIRAEIWSARAEESGRTENLVVGVQVFQVVSAMTKVPPQIEAVAPHWRAKGIALGGFRNLEASRTYLLIGDLSSGKRLTLTGYFSISRIERSGGWQSYTTVAKSQDEVAGWALVGLRSGVFESAASPPGAFLKTLAREVESGGSGAEDDALHLLARTSRYSVRTEFEYLPSRRGLLAQLDSIDGVQVDRFFEEQIEPRIWRAASNESLGIAFRLRALQLLADWGSDEARRQWAVLKARP